MANKLLKLDQVVKLIEELSLLRYFPSDTGARTALAKLILAMCPQEDRTRWLVRRVLSLYNEWPGPLEFRAVLCSKFPPADGIEANSSDPRFLSDGIPSENPQKERPRQIQGETDDPACRALVKMLADKKSLM